MSVISSHLVAVATLALASFAPIADDHSCDLLRAKFYAGAGSPQLLRQLASEIKTDSLCGKNLLGSLAATGTYIPANSERAYAIFYDLAQRDYPPAQLNLGLMLSQRGQQFDLQVPTYLLGVFARYFGDKKWGHIGASARDLGRQYFDDELKSDAIHAAEIVSYKDKYESAVIGITKDTAVQLLQRERATIERNNSIAGMLALGVLLYDLPSIRLFQSPVPKPPTVTDLYNWGVLK